MISSRAADLVPARLRSIDWDFTRPVAREAIHDIHPYPARFVPQIPRELIRMFHPGDDSVVLDPFCGCGTSLVEATAAGLPAVGVDLNPLAVLISEVKTTPLRERITPAAAEVIRGRASKSAAIPEIPRLDHWFKPEIQRALAELLTGIEAVADSSTRNALRVALSRIIVRVSNQDSDTRYAAVANNVSESDVYDLFMQSSEVVDSALADAYAGLFARKPRVQVLHQDVLTLKPESIGGEVGLVVTSPPYPNAYEYWLYHKYRMYWLGMDPIALRTAEIGARPHYFKKNHQTEADFEVQMAKVFRLLGRVLPVGRFACFVIGRSIIHGRHIDNVQLLARAASTAGFDLVGSVDRSIARNRKSFNLFHAAITQETIAVFQLKKANL